VFRWATTLIGNLKTAFRGTYHPIDVHKYRARYLAEAPYRFNHRFDLRAMVGQFLRACLAIPPSTKDHRKNNLNIFFYRAQYIKVMIVRICSSYKR